MPSQLDGKVCVITGRGGTIGGAFAREGASVVGCDGSVGAAPATVELVRGSGRDTVYEHSSHLTDSANRRALPDLALRGFGRVDGSLRLTPSAYFSRLERITLESAADKSPCVRGADILTLAVGLGSDRIAVTAVAPGLTRTRETSRERVPADATGGHHRSPTDCTAASRRPRPAPPQPRPE